MVVIPDRASQRNNFQSSRCHGRGSSASATPRAGSYCSPAGMAGLSATVDRRLPSSQGSSSIERSGRA